MPNKRSYFQCTSQWTQAQLKRWRRDWWYRTAHSAPGRKFIELPAEDVAAAKVMMKARAVHRLRASEIQAGKPAHSLQGAARLAHALSYTSGEQLRADLQLNKEANRYKHEPTLFSPTCGPSRAMSWHFAEGNWADCGSEHSSSSHAPSHFNTTDNRALLPTVCGEPQGADYDAGMDYDPKLDDLMLDAYLYEAEAPLRAAAMHFVPGHISHHFSPALSGAYLDPTWSGSDFSGMQSLIDAQNRSLAIVTAALENALLLPTGAANDLGSQIDSLGQQFKELSDRHQRFEMEFEMARGRGIAAVRSHAQLHDDVASLHQRLDAVEERWSTSPSFAKELQSFLLDEVKTLSMNAAMAAVDAAQSSWLQQLTELAKSAKPSQTERPGPARPKPDPSLTQSPLAALEERREMSMDEFLRVSSEIRLRLAHHPEVRPVLSIRDGFWDPDSDSDFSQPGCSDDVFDDGDFVGANAFELSDALEAPLFNDKFDPNKDSQVFSACSAKFTCSSLSASSESKGPDT